MVEFPFDQVSERLLKRYPKLKKLETIEKVEPAKISNYGNFERITSVKLTGKNGKTDFLRAEDLRLTLDPTGKKIKSTACKIIKTDDKLVFYNGRGFGHGIGMCQCGVQAMARRGKTADQILSYYYPTSKIRKLY